MIIALKTAVFCLDQQDPNNAPRLMLDAVDVRCVIEGSTVRVIALTDNSLLVFNDDEHRRIKTGISDRIDSLCILQEKPIELLIGTTPPYLYRLIDDGPAQRIPTFDDLAVRPQWFTPWGGPAAVRSLAKTQDGWVYADIHVGSIMRSPDNGRTWEPVTPSLHRDVHEVTTSRASNRRVYANTFLSVYLSTDRGESWNHRSNNLQNRYGRGIAVHPEDPEIMLCGVSDGPTGVNVHGQLYYTDDGGLNWSHVTKGFPHATRQNIDTFHIAFMGDNAAWVTDENTLFRSNDRGKTWEPYWQAPKEIIMISSTT